MLGIYSLTLTFPLWYSNHKESLLEAQKKKNTMDEIKIKQQVVEKIKESEKILVTVSNNPSVDELSAALALTLLLDKQSKYATAIFSGETPPAIAFLEPEKTFDDTTDSLRDFIIALNKEKADHLRYKVEGDAVKIFITPYKTVIDERDLEFSQGDYNVELVIALGVSKQDDLDVALANHGQILHDASIITMTAGDQSSSLGGIDWHDDNASGVSEMVAGIAEALKVDKKKSLLDEPIATALLTGIVAQTDRFSNEHTTSRSMTVAANLMAAGADQQLIANELQAVHEAAESEESEGDEAVEIIDKSGSSSDDDAPKDPSMLSINHDGESLADLDRRVLGEEGARKKVTEEVAALQDEAAEAEVSESVKGDSAADDAYAAIEEANAQRLAEREAEVQAAREAVRSNVDVAEGPTLGGTLNATTEQAADDARREAADNQNRTILSHTAIGHDEADAAVESIEADDGIPGVSPEPVTKEEPLQGSHRVIEPLPQAELDALRPAEAPEPVVEPEPQVLGSAAPQDVTQSEQQAASDNAYGIAAPAFAEPAPMDLGLPMPPPIPDFSQANGTMPFAPAQPFDSVQSFDPAQQFVPAQPFAPVAESTGLLGDILAEPAPQPVQAYGAYDEPGVPAAAEPVLTTVVEQAPPLPPMANPADLALPAQPIQFEPIVPSAAYGAPEPAPVFQTESQPVAAAPADPGQFQIPTPV